MLRPLPVGSCFVLAAVWLGTPNEAAAQRAPGNQECQAAAAALAGGDRDPINWEILPECGLAGGDALAQALAGAGAESGGFYLQMLTNLAGSVQVESILDAAEGLARDAGATRAARVAGILTLLGQYDSALYFPISHTWQDLISTALSECRLLPLTGSDWVDQHPMPRDHVERIRAVMHDLAHANQEDPVVQSMATCIARYVE